MDKSEKTAFTIGLLSGGALILVPVLVLLLGSEGACEKQHNVYDCKRIYVPVTEGEK